MARKPMLLVPPRIRRAYYEFRHGQLHLHNAIPAGGGFDELTPALCLHGHSETGAVFLPLLLALGEQRSVYAPDLPGQGQTDPAPPESEPVAAAAQAMGDFLDSARIRRVDLIARGEGAAVARLLWSQYGQMVRKMVLIADVSQEPESAGLPTLAVSADEADATGLAARIGAFLDS
jgi:pimeloyl-ACP methyl ester carboxylesterase